MRYLVNRSTGELKEENAAVSLDIIAPEEETAVASRAYAEGEQFILEGKLYAATAAIASGASIVTEGAGANAEEAPNVIKQIENHTPAGMTGASSLADGTAGLVPQPHAGDEDKVLQGKGVWGKKLQFDVVIQNGVFGYLDENNTFHALNAASELTGQVGLAHGGTGASDATAARTNLGLGAAALIGTPISVANGGTGATSAATARTNLGVAGAVTDITRSGTTFTATKADGSTFTFTQQDNNTTYSAGTGLSLSSTTFALADPFKANSTCNSTGTRSFAEGYKTTASSSSSHAEGESTRASGSSSHAEGYRTTASSSSSHAEGYFTSASGSSSHAEGESTIAFGDYSHAEGSGTTASERSSHAEGYFTTASGSSSHAEGESTRASGSGSHAEGYFTIAFGYYSHAEGACTTASGTASHTEGYATSAFGDYSHAEGENTTASSSSSHAEGNYTCAAATNQHVGGMYNKVYTGSSGTGGALLIVGKGSTNSARANCFRVTTANIYATAAYSSSGADYAEMFEWEDQNPDKEDRAGYFVTISDNKIKIANSSDDFILGIVSGNPSCIGDVYDDQWNGMFETDIFGRPVYETYFNEDTLKYETREKLNPNYDPTKEYIPRSARPEWDAVGLVGKLIALDDGTAEVNGWVKPNDYGVATASPTATKFRVMKRLDESHIQVLIL